MNLAIVAVGKLREPFYRAGVDEYLMRIRRFLPIEQIEVPTGTGEESNGKGKGALGKEAASIENRLSADSRVVALDPAGKLMSTEEFSRWLQEAMNTSVPRVNFVIGGAWGLASSVSERANLKLSLSPMTFPHELARLVLAEQIYRALTLWKGLPYHK
ncbi:MAG TPA: 23S rRNA (pseudouridine(1915)-N(3))-methyltransferase RlmH [bacterium]|jgi:23S rRNA (pseudouridine1915-N3)-methyltransferase